MSSFRWPSDRIPKAGETFGPFRLEAILGEGGSGIVFRASRDPDGALCALKLLRPELSQDPVQQHRFAHEVRVAGEVLDRHLVPILEAGEIEGIRFLAQALIDGTTLRELLIHEGPLPLPKVCAVIAGVASGLDALHRAGLVHRDVKTSNIIIESGGEAMLTDFGLSRGRAYTVLTAPGQVVGTLDYLAPELFRGAEASQASDIYALGCVAYEAASGHAPFAHKSALAVALAHLEESPPDLSAGDLELPDTFSWAVMRALAKEPAERPATATGYANLLAMAAGDGGR